MLEPLLALLEAEAALAEDETEAAAFAESITVSHDSIYSARERTHTGSSAVGLCRLSFCLGSIDSGTSIRQGGVARKRREFDTGSRSLGLESGDLGGVVVGLLGQLGGVCGKIDDLLEVAHVFAVILGSLGG